MTPPPFFEDLIQQLEYEEGCKLVSYRDQNGFWTVGYGSRFLLDGTPVVEDTVITMDDALALLRAKALAIGVKLELDLPWIDTLDDVRQLVLWEMAYQLGDAGTEAFHQTLALVEAGNYAEASTDMLQSLWAKETPQRAHRLAARMASGI